MTVKLGLKKLLKMIMSEKKLFFGSLIFMLLTTLGKLLDPLVIAHIIDVSVPSGDLKNMFHWGIFFAVVILLSGVLSYLQIIWMAKLGIKIITNMKYDLFNHLLLLPVSWFDKTPVGELISRVESDCERVKELFSSFSVTIVGNVLFFFGMIIVLFMKNWIITCLLFIPFTVVIIVALILIRLLAKWYKRSRELNAEITGRLTEYIQGISTVQIFNQQQKTLAYINEKSKAKQKNDTVVGFLDWGVWGFNDFLVQTVFMVMIILYLSPKIINETVSIGLLVIFIQYSIRLVWPIIQISENLNQFQRAFISLKRVFSLLDEKPEQNKISQDVSLSTEITFPDNISSEEIEFQNVWFQYKEDEWVLKDVSFKIKKGAKVALVGASGSGKTTIVSLLCRFYTINQGSILVNGVDLYSIDLHQWRKKIGLILQDLILFPGSLLENIRIYNDELSEARVTESITLSQAVQLLERMNNDLHQEIKERGQNLSVGERQLLAFARALCFDTEMIIMDEATASIDVKTEVLMQKSLDLILNHKTSLIVAHRLVSVLNSEEILYLEKGEIKARGTHESLMNNSPEYKRLVELQFDTYTS